MNLVETLHRYKEEGKLYSQEHPSLPLTIWNYTPKTQYEGLWDDITLMCRGLVTDDTGKIVARPFKKFFNLEENRHIPTQDFEVFEKLDGSLIILFWYCDQWIIASRGSFTSDHVNWATEIFREKYWSSTRRLRKSMTYCFELIHPENRIVVDYGDRQDLILTAVFNTESGTEYYSLFIFDDLTVVKKFTGLDWKNIKNLNWKNSEGFVVRFFNGSRCKIKFEDYIRLHRVMTNISEKKIWKALKDGSPISSILENVPDEFFNEVNSIETNLKKEYLEIEKSYLSIFASYKNDFNGDYLDRKVFAKYASKYQNPSILFSMLDCKDYSQQIWKILEP